MRAYYQALEQPSNENNTNHTYEIWRKMNIDNRTNIDANKLANARRDIVKNKRLTDTELEGIRTDIRKEHRSPKIAAEKNSEGRVDITREAFTALYTPENSVEHSLHPEPTEQKRKILDIKHQIVEKWKEIKFIEI